MRAELSAVVGEVIATLDIDQDLGLNDAETDRLLAAADVVTLARTGVEYDYQGNVIDAHAPEMPTRFLRELQQIVRGGLALGMDRNKAMRLAIRCARDTMPPIRLAVIDDLAKHGLSRPGDIRRRIDLPWRTVDRQCQALHMLDVLSCDEEEVRGSGGHPSTIWRYSLAEGIDPEALKPSPDLAHPALRPFERGIDQEAKGDVPWGPPAKSGNGSAQVSSDETTQPDCRICGSGLLHPTSIERGVCFRCVEAGAA
jgi:hypothetical protein